MNLAPLHPRVVHFPIALLLLGSAAALLYLFGPRAFRFIAPAELRTLAWWPLRLGWLGVALAVLTGLFDQGRLPPQAPYSATLNWHIGSGLALLVVYGILLYRQWLWKKQRRPPDGVEDLLDSPAARPWVALLLAVGIALVVLSGWLGGALVYTWGVNVDALPR
ncbi:MAG TPA: DUF2231 domain-containing protein [Caldilineaceae bacterium]|nr:DUF2231 domain-containing protein [Caldilineaceae bacterium]